MPKFVSFLIFLCFFHLHQNMADSANNSILPGQRISFLDTIVSSGGVFELGFFTPENSSNYYVGIWYKIALNQTVVWVANRNYPVTGTSGVLTIHPDGNLVISDQQFAYMVTNTSSKGNTSAVLLDSGNLVLKDSNDAVLWQSFDTPTHVLLSGMKFGINKMSGIARSLVSWRSTGDPRSGEFSLKYEYQNNQFIIMKGSQMYWVSGIWNGKSFSLIPEMQLNKFVNFSFTSNEIESYFSYSPYNSSTLSFLQLDVSGRFKQLTWSESSQRFDILWSQPKVECEVYGFCGPFGVCNQQANSICQCLFGFEPRFSEDWEKEKRSGGCTRKIPLQCEDTTAAKGNEDKFVKMSSMKHPANARLQVLSDKECMRACSNNCSCIAYAHNESGGCSVWDGGLLNLQQLSDEDKYGDIIYVKVAASALQGAGVNKKLLWILIPVVACFLLGCYFSCQLWNKRKLKGMMESGEDILVFDMNVSTNAGNGKSNESGLPLFSFSSVSAATDNFSPLNKLGEGGFGPVYKGTVLKGYEIAVKRLSKRSGQGLDELRNEALLIAKLQHMNLVKLLGCCLEREEKILVYEFMLNKSLDTFLFADPIKRSLLDWKTRVRVVEGIAQGLLYLHQYSRLKIIHRDLKASNILLDADMNPKISDFGLARIFGGNESEANTNRIAGTYGYMSPEYALEGIFSVKSDVFSFGVLLLEIVSGKKNTGFYQTDSINLLGYAWDLWKNNKALELMDPVWENEPSKNIVLRYINVAFLCVQEFAADRPAMFEVVAMLTNVGAILPSPKEPAFSKVNIVRTPKPPRRRAEVLSSNDVTLTLLEAR